MEELPRTTGRVKTKEKVWSIDMADNLESALKERDALRATIKEALHLIEFHKYLLGEDFVRNKLVNILKKR